MNITIYALPDYGPKKPFLLLVHTFESINRCTWFAFVCPENAVVKNVYVSL